MYYECEVSNDEVFVIENAIIGKRIIVKSSEGAKNIFGKDVGLTIQQCYDAGMSVFVSHDGRVWVK